VKRSNALERYELIDRYAVGGAAEIFRAKDKDTGTVVAIKRLKPDADFDPEMQAGFLRERQLAELSAHKNLIRAFDHGSQNGAEWVALEFVHGKELASLVRRLGKKRETLPTELALFIVREVLDGMAFAYNIEDDRGRPLGLVHRDLNPRNILVGFGGDVRVCDFGASHASLTEPTPTECVGSLGYLSPEQVRCDPLDARSDVFAAGVVLYELVVGGPAFPIHKEAKALKLHRKGKLARIPRGVDEQLRWILEEATAADPEQRFESASTMRTAVEQLLTDHDTGSLHDALSDLMHGTYTDEA
jgi:serine/threonine-protein kinase